MGWKHHSEMTLEEMEAEVLALESHFEMCKELEQGINTKDTVRYRACKKALSEAVTCKFCHRLTRADTAHLHQGEWVGNDCCWDERLRSTE
jgi:hypothetical protein